MNDTLYHYIDPDFNHTQVGNYTLLLLLSSDNFSLAVMHRQKLMVWRKTAPLAEFTQPGEVQEVLNFAYREVITGLVSPNFTLIPQSLFEEDGVSDVARYLDVQPTDHIFVQPLDADNQVIFKTVEAIITAASRFDLNNALFGATGWIKAIAANQPSAYHLYLNLNDHRFEVAYFKHGKLYLYNTFEFTHEDELAYYTVFVSQQLKLDMSTITVVLGGNIATGDKRYHTILGDIFKTVELNTLTVAHIPESLPQHQLLSLTALQLCASLADA
ncbi:DUF3822 family protein [Mucilaginibacter terrae]|uniref:DUF3822 family protein n=1 Tax=Mucilaginibacter terrae TaxID=1955052 RepID=UPI003630C0C5